MQDKTVGAIALELQQNATHSVSPIDVQKAQEKEYLDNLIFAVQHARKKIDCSSIDGHDSCKDLPALEGDFFIEVLLKKEELLHNVIRNYFLARVSCPTPMYDHTVYRWNDKKQDIEYLWTVPDRETCLTFKENISRIVPEEQALLKMILMFYDGSLKRLAKKLNKEKMSAGVALEGK